MKTRIRIAAMVLALSMMLCAAPQMSHGEDMSKHGEQFFAFIELFLGQGYVNFAPRSSASVQELYQLGEEKEWKLMVADENMLAIIPDGVAFWPFDDDGKGLVRFVTIAAMFDNLKDIAQQSDQFSGLSVTYMVWEESEGGWTINQDNYEARILFLEKIVRTSMDGVIESAKALYEAFKKSYATD